MTRNTKVLVAVSNFQLEKQQVARNLRNALLPASQRRIVLLLAIFAVFSAGQICSSVAVAQDRVWINTTNGSNALWDIGNNWTPLGAPSATDQAIFGTSATYNVFWDPITEILTPSVGSIAVTSGNVTFQNEVTQSITHTVNGNMTVSGPITGWTNRGLQMNIASDFNVSDGANVFVDGTHAAGSRLNVGGLTTFSHGQMTFDNGAIGNFAGGIDQGVDNPDGASLSILGGSSITSGTFRMGESTGNQEPVPSQLLVSGLGSTLQLTGSSAFDIGRFNGGGQVQLVDILNGGSLQIGTGRTHISNGIMTVRNAELESQGRILIDGSGPDAGQLIVRTGGIVSSSAIEIIENGLLSVSSGSEVATTGDLQFGGVFGRGRLRIESGGVVSSRNSRMGHFVLIGRRTSVATVTGPGSLWQNTGLLQVGVDDSALLSIDLGGKVTNASAHVGVSGSSFQGTVNVNGQGSQWINSGDLRIGAATDSNGLVNINEGSFVSSRDGIIGFGTDSSGIVNVADSDSHWEVTRDLSVSHNGVGELNISNGGLVSVAGLTTLGASGQINMTDARFEFGSTSLPDFSRINAMGGSLAGNVDVQGTHHLATLTGFQNEAVDISEVATRNHGLLHGTAILKSSLNNQASGELRTLANDWARFEGSGNINAGEINNFGGMVDFDKDATNSSSGFIGGRGQFVANGGWTNEGVMAFSGTTDILGDIINQNNGQIVTSGGATTTIFDDLVHNGVEIRTSAGGNTVIFGEASGAGNYTGTGTVFFEGDLRPGNSPASVLFEGDVVFGSGANSFIELAGLGLGEFDQLAVSGDLSLGGELYVDLIDGFQLAFNSQFLIADVGGELFGQFAGLAEGDLVGNFGEKDLFISYSAGNGNGVALFTSVPEPGGIIVLGALGLVILFRRPHRNQQI